MENGSHSEFGNLATSISCRCSSLEAQNRIFYITAFHEEPTYLLEYLVILACTISNIPKLKNGEKAS
jgi:hypothetical protein